MNSKIDIYSPNILESYLDGSLTADLQAQVESRIATDPSYSEAIRQMRQVQAGLQVVARATDAGSTMRPAAQSRARAAMHAALDGKAPASRNATRFAAPLLTAMLVIVVALVAWPLLNSNVSSSITPTPLAAPRADFSAEQQKPDRLIVKFTNTSTNYSTQSWDFGDGQQSTERNPIHLYANYGVYTVTLTVRNSSANAVTKIPITLK